MCSDESPLGIFDMIGRYAVPQGADWDVGLIYTENSSVVDFSDATARMQIRSDYDKDIILELSSEDGTIELSDGAGDTPNVVLKFGNNTSDLTKYEGIYDLEVTTSGGLVKKFLEGKFELRKEVTK